MHLTPPRTTYWVNSFVGYCPGFASATFSYITAILIINMNLLIINSISLGDGFIRSSSWGFTFFLLIAPLTHSVTATIKGNQ
jgi:hypothetical protein